MHVSYNMHAIDCNMPVTYVTSSHRDASSSAVCLPFSIGTV